MGALTSDKTVLDVREITKSFGRTSVLRGASFKMRPGEIVGIVGQNGTGKSTILKIVMGLLGADSGSVERQGSIGYCPQEPAVFEALTVRENYRYFATAYGMGDKQADWQLTKDRLLDEFDFASEENRPVSQLSGGTKQKLNLTLALFSSPDILILDEPYSGFDWETYLRFWEHAEGLKRNGKSVLIISHLINDRSRFDRIYDLKDGTLQCAGTT